MLNIVVTVSNVVVTVSNVVVTVSNVVVTVSNIVVTVSNVVVTALNKLPSVFTLFALFVFRGASSRTPVYSLSYNPAENAVLVCTVSSYTTYSRGFV